VVCTLLEQTETCTVEDLSDGCGAKIDILLVSDKFEGMALLDRQRAVHAALEAEMKTIHAITMKCKTVKQWNAMQNSKVQGTAS
jgi:stress-induced morphogen